MSGITKSNEDYLEAIYELSVDNKTSSIDIAKKLNITKAAVSIACNNLLSKGLIEKESYGDIALTSKGLTIAISITAKHKFIQKWLLSIGVCEQTANTECCQLEHVFSDETLECIKKQIIK